MVVAADARNLFKIVRKGIDVRAVHSHVRKPFRFLLCGYPALVAGLRSLLLSGHDEVVPPHAARIQPHRRFPSMTARAR